MATTTKIRKSASPKKAVAKSNVKGGVALKSDVMRLGASSGKSKTSPRHASVAALRKSPARDFGARDIGQHLRQAREAAGISVRELARRIGLSASMISQVELNQSRPSVGTLFQIANALGLVLDDLFRDDTSHLPLAVPTHHAPHSSPHLKRGQRETIRLADQVQWERLTAPDPEVEFLHVVYEVGGESCAPDQMVRHGGKEYAYLMQGQLGVKVGFDVYMLEPGDSISFDAQTPHRLWNASDEPAIAIWTVIRRHNDRRHS
jgi:transcriptional regulator with XRE-family HTH domain